MFYTNNLIHANNAFYFFFIKNIVDVKIDVRITNQPTAHKKSANKTLKREQPKIITWNNKNLHPHMIFFALQPIYLLVEKAE